MSDFQSDPLYKKWYYAGDVVRLTGLSKRQLQYWDEIGFFPPSGKSPRRRKYSFTDLIQLQVIARLLEKGASLQRIRGGMEKLGEILPAVSLPFLELEIDTDGENIFVHHKDAWFEAHTGQYMISFRVEDFVREMYADPAYGIPSAQDGEGRRARAGGRP